MTSQIQTQYNVTARPPNVTSLDYNLTVAWDSLQLQVDKHTETHARKGTYRTQSKLTYIHKSTEIMFVFMNVCMYVLVT